MEDKILLIALSKGSVSAFDALYRKYAPRVEQFASFLLADADFSKADVDDLIQELFVKLWQKRQTIAKDVDNFNAYIFKMTKNAVLNLLTRRKMIRTALDESDEIVSQDDILAAAIAMETENAIKSAIDKMPAERRRVFEMSRGEGLQNKEIAKELNISTKTVEYHISRALSDIRKNIS